MPTVPLLLARSLFLLGCLVPTLAIGGWQAARHWPGRQTALLESLAQQLGWQLECEGVSIDPSGRAVLEGLTATDPETGHRLLRCRRLEALPTPEGWLLIASQPEVEADRLNTVWRTIEERLLRANSATAPACRLTCQELTLLHAAQPQTLLEVEAEWNPAADRAHAFIAFRLAGYDLPTPVRLTAVRDRTANPPATRLELQTAASKLPVSLAAGVWPEVRRLGDDCWFQGSVWLSPTRRPLAPRGAPVLHGEGWDGEVAGHFTGLDLGRLIGEPFHPHRLTGRIDASLTANIVDGRLITAAGSLAAHDPRQPIVVGRSLLDAAASALRLIPTARAAQGETLVATQLACDFQLNEAGLALKGRLPASPPGTLLADAAGPLLSEPTYERVPVVSLVQTVAGAGGEPIPATREAAALLRLLPIPRAQQTPGAPTRVWLEE